MLTLFEAWLKVAVLEVQEYVRLSMAAIRGVVTRPFYRHDDPRPLVPGQSYKFEIEILPTSYLFKKGHRIRLEIVNGDSSQTDMGWVHPYHPDKVGSDTIYHDAARPSRLLLPVMPAD